MGRPDFFSVICQPRGLLIAIVGPASWWFCSKLGCKSGFGPRVWFGLVLNQQREAHGGELHSFFLVSRGTPLTHAARYMTSRRNAIEISWLDRRRENRT